LCVGIIRWCENNAFIVKQTALCCHYTILLFTRNGVCWNKLRWHGAKYFFSIQSHSNALDYAAGGFKDFSRIASSDATMWRDICINNPKDAKRDSKLGEQKPSRTPLKNQGSTQIHM
jgi:hypothetical protein